MQEPDSLDTAERVAGWIHSLDIVPMQIESDKFEDVDNFPDDAATPETPPRRIPRPQLVEELSPTNTSFSAGTIFDSPVEPTGSGALDDCGTSDATSVDGEEHTCLREARHVENSDRLEVNTSADIDDQRTGLPVYTLEPLGIATRTEILDCENATQSPSTPSHHQYGPSPPRLIRLTSCQQCVLLNLPCSRTPPSCSRCRRHGHEDFCLLQRRRLPEEISYLTARDYTVPVLLKLAGEDEEIWRRKVELAEDMREVWRRKKDLENWVLPDVCTRRGGWNGEVERGGSTDRMGEGLGKAVYKELSVYMGYSGDT